jgi:hypothetical protein
VKHGPILVMRFGPLIGRLDGPKITNVAHRAFTLDDALAWLRRGGIGRENRCWWIARGGSPAHVTQSRKR